MEQKKMKILKRAKEKHRFFILRSFSLKGGKRAIPNEFVESDQFDDEGMIVSLVQRRYLIPAEMVEKEVDEYIALRSLELPGETAKFSCEILERIQLTPFQAIDLMLQKRVIPADPDRWRPWNLRLIDQRKR
jgi:hypothetical protein